MQIACALLFLLQLILPTHANATLGEQPSAVGRTMRANKNANSASSSQSKLITNFEIHETAADGNIIREFTNTDGIVFAITWEGIQKPDLSLLLGRFHSEFSKLEESQINSHAHAQTRPLTRAPRTLRTPQIVVEKGGTFQHKRGRAYVPSLIPEGVNPEDLR